MSNIYIQEPPTNGKILLETTVGDIDIELWSREAPKACRNFIQLCMQGYYNGTIFHRLVKGFIVQGGDPTGTGTGGQSIWNKTFKDEFHSRLRFTRRGLLAMANAGRDDNGSQFFFTLGATPELQNKHTIFGKVAGNTIYNMIKLEEGPVDEDEKPVYPHKIIGTKILNNPFDDIVPVEPIKNEKVNKKPDKQVAATKNYKLLSFGEEAEEAEEEDAEINKMFTGKGKSSHDLTSDPKLSSALALDIGNKSKDVEENSRLEELTVESVREKLKKRDTQKKPETSEAKHISKPELSDEEEEYYLGKTEDDEKKKKLLSLQKEFKDLKREMKRSNIEKVAEAQRKQDQDDDDKSKLALENSLVKEFFDEQKKYKDIKTELKKQGDSREAATLAMLAKFQKKIETAKETYGSTLESSKPEVDEDELKDDDSWLAQTLHYEELDPVLAKDANLKSDDWFEIYDPRNPLTKRRRGEDKQGETSKKQKK